MAKLTLSIIFGLAFVLADAGGAAAELAKKSKYDVTLCWGGELHVVPHAKGYMAGTYRLTGATRSNGGGGLFDKDSFECIGVFHYLDKEPGHIGFCQFVDKDGDKVFGKDVRNKAVYTFEFVSGTGKYQGIKGGGKTERIGAYPSARKGTAQGCARTTGSYTLP